MADNESSAVLRLVIDTGDAAPASADLDKVSQSAHAAEQSFDNLRATAETATASVRDVGEGAKLSSADIKEISQAYYNLQKSIDPLVVASQRFAQDQKILDDALQAGIITSDQYKAQQAELNRQFEQTKVSVDGITKDFRQLEASLDPVKAATNEYHHNMDTLDKALEKGIIDQARYNQLVKQANAAYQDAIAGTKKYSNQLGSLITRIAATATAYLSLREAFRFFDEATVKAREQAQAMAQVEKGIESTGGAAERTASQIQKLTEAMQKQSLAADEQLQLGAANLLTFTNIKGSNFDRTLQSALDVSTRVGQDLISTVIQLGKALNDPIANLGELGRTGIQFSAEQKEMIHQLVQQNQLFKAQDIILTELERQYGGSAKALRDAQGGAVAAKVAFGDLMEQIGGPILENTNQAWEDLTATLQDPKTAESARLIGDALADSMTAALNVLNDWIKTFNGFIDDAKRAGIIKTDIHFTLNGQDITPDKLQSSFLTDAQVGQITLSLNEESVKSIQQRIESLTYQINTSLALIKQTPDDPQNLKLQARVGSYETEVENLQKILDKAKQFFPDLIDSTKTATDQVGELGKGMQGVADHTKDAANAINDYGIKVRTIYDDLERHADQLAQLNAAQLQGPVAVADVERHLAVEEQVYQMRLKAEQAQKAFDEDRARADIQRLYDLQQEHDLLQKIYQTQQDIASIPVNDAFKAYNTFLNSPQLQAGLSSPSDLARQQAVAAGNAQLQHLAKVLQDLSSSLDTETYKKFFDDLHDAGVQWDDTVKKSGEDFKQSVEEATSSFVKNVLGDLIFNRGRGLLDIFKNEAQQGVNDTLIKAVSDVAAGAKDAAGNLKSFGSAFKENLDAYTQKFQNLGDQLDHLLNTKVFGGANGALAGAGASIAGFQTGSGLADLINGSQGETGGKIGGAVGGTIGFVVGGPLGAAIGSAVGGFFGDIFGGLFGRKTASGTFNLDTGQTSGDNSKVSARNDRRDQVLQDASDAIHQLAQILDAQLEPGYSIVANVAKSHISTSIVDSSGRTVATGANVGTTDIAGAVSQELNAALNTIIKGGDERLRNIAEALSNANLPVDKFLSTLSDVANVFALVEEPESDFAKGLHELVDAFNEATSAAQSYGGSVKDIADQQLSALQEYAKTFDQTIAEADRNIVNPIEQQAIDLGKQQEQRIKDANELNQALLDAANKATQAATSAPTSVPGQATASTFNADAYLAANPFLKSAYSNLPADTLQWLAKQGYSSNINDLLRYDYNTYGSQRNPIPAPSAAATGTDLTTTTDLAAEAADRMAKVIQLNTDEWKQFIEQAANSPEAFKAAADALDELKKSAEAGSVDVSTLDQTLESVRQSLADSFDQSQQKRYLDLTNPQASQLMDILKAQNDYLNAARQISSDAADLQKRLEEVSLANTEELKQFIENAGNSADTLKNAADALQQFAQQIQDAGGNLDILQKQLADAQQALIDKADEQSANTILSAISTPYTQFKQLLDQQKQDFQTKQDIGANLTLAQQGYALQLENFLKGLSDADLASLGDVLGQVENTIGRLPVVLLELDNAFTKFLDNRVAEQQQADQLAQRGSDLASASHDLGQNLKYTVGGLSQVEILNQLQIELNAQKQIAEDTTKTDKERLDAVQKGNDLISQVSAQTTKALGGGTAAAAEQTSLIDLAAEFENISKTIGDNNASISEQLDSSNVLLTQIRDKLDSPDTDTVKYLSDILSSGELNNTLTADVSSLLTEFVNLSKEQQTQRDDVIQSIRDAAIQGFSGGVSVNGVVTIDDTKLASLLQEAIDTLSRIEDNQIKGTTEAGLLNTVTS